MLLNSQPPKQLSYDIELLAAAFGSESEHDCSIILLSKLPVTILSEVSMLNSVSMIVYIFREGCDKLNLSCLVLLV